MEREQAKKIIEALLFSSEVPLSVVRIKEVLEELDTGTIKALITQLKDEYTDSARSYNITEVAGGYQMCTDPQYALWLKKLYRSSRIERLSHPSLETLAIVAYRQPVTRQEVEDVRGVNVDGVLKTLLEKSLVRISGRKPIVGRPFLYSTTRQFLEFFGLQSLADLPKLEEFEQVGLQIKPSGSSGGREDGEIKEIAQENRPD